MTWINNLKNRFGNSRVLQTEKSFLQDRCPILLDSMPDPSVIIDVDELISFVDFIADITYGNPICDIVAFCSSKNQPIAILIEAKTDRTHTNARTRQAISQLSWSFQHFDKIALTCPLLPIQCRPYAVLTHTNINNAVLRSETVKTEFRRFRRNHGAKIFYVRAGHDIWQAIQRNRP